MVDVALHYSYIYRNIVFLKTNMFWNTYNFPLIKYLVVICNIMQVRDIDNMRYVGFVFMYRFFFGSRAFLYLSKKIFSLNKWYHTLQIQVYLRRARLLSSVSLMITDIFPFLVTGVDYYGTENLRTWNADDMMTWHIHDVTLFAEKKGGVGLFYLKDPIQLKLNIPGYTWREKKIILNCFKLWYLHLL